MTQRAKEALEKDIIIIYDGQHCQHDEGATRAQQLPTKTTNFNPTNELTLNINFYYWTTGSRQAVPTSRPRG